MNPITKQVLALEPKYQAMSDADLQPQTAVFKKQLAEGKTLDDLLPDAFAAVSYTHLDVYKRQVTVPVTKLKSSFLQRTTNTMLICPVNPT